MREIHCWDETKVEEWSAVRARAKAAGQTCHLGRLFAFCSEKNSELPLDHPLYHGVFSIKAKGQIPNYRLGIQSEFDPEHRTWETVDSTVVHHRAMLDDHGRIMVLATHNTDNGDGWEREGENDYFFHNFSEKIAYPLGINIIYYAMTH